MLINNLIAMVVLYIQFSTFLSVVMFCINLSVIPLYNIYIYKLYNYLMSFDESFNYSFLKKLLINENLSSIRLRYGIFSNLFFIVFFSFIFFYYVWFYNVTYTIILFSFKSYTFSITIDWLSSSMLVLVSFISTVVHGYSLWYMKLDFNLDKFLVLLSCFTGSMLFLVLGGNLLQNFIGWELVGVFSFLLISFWESRREAVRAACKALFLNKIGDIAFMIALVIVYNNTGSFNINNLNFISTFYIYFMCYNLKIVDIITVCFFIAAAAKSSQFGLHMWLIDAMEGPTPVSALIHAATMVTAGIFLLIRTNIIFKYCSKELCIFISFWGILTAFVGGFLAIFQFDIKKIIAYSTMSQLGYMMSVLPFDVTLSLFHLINHGWFKALLFLSAGVVIHHSNNEQDIRRMKPLLYKQLPITFIMFVLASFTMIALPLTSGFFSKDLVYELLVYSKLYEYYYNLLIITGVFTIIYSVRLIFFVFFKKGFLYNRMYIYDPFYVVLVVFIPLIFITIVSGYVFVILLKQAHFAIVFNNLNLINVFFLLFTLFYFILKYKFNLITVKDFGFIFYFYSFILNRFFLDTFFNKVFYYYFVFIAWYFYSVFEMGWIMFFVGPGVSHFFRYVSVLFKLFERFDSFHIAIIGIILVIVITIFL